VTVIRRQVARGVMTAAIPGHILHQRDLAQLLVRGP